MIIHRICKHCPSLASFNFTTPRGTADNDLLKKAFEGSHISLKLLMFHVYFVMNYGTRGGTVSIDSICDNYDLFFGRPSLKQRNSFQNHVKKILECSSWPQFFQMIGLKPPSPVYLTDWLKDSFRNSRRKGYHSDTTNFSAVHRSGVSKILLKGESYTASPTLKKVLLEEGWGFEGDNVIFLDASCLIYGFKGEYKEYADYSHTSACGGAIRHSGDVIDYEKSSGKHTINIDLSALPLDVKSLYFTITAFTTTLKDIKQPHIRYVCYFSLVLYLFLPLLSNPL